jgi:hypothetical protein
MKNTYSIKLKKLQVIKEQKDIMSKLIGFIKSNPITFIYQIAQFIPNQSVQQIIDTLDLDFQDTQNLDKALNVIIQTNKTKIDEFINKFKPSSSKEGGDVIKHQKNVVYLFLSQTTIPRDELILFIESLSGEIILKFYSYIKIKHLTRFRFAKECLKLSSLTREDGYPANIFDLLDDIFSKSDDDLKSKIIKKFAGHFSEILIKKIFNKMFDDCFFNQFLNEVFGGEKIIKLKTIRSNRINLKENSEKIDVFKKFIEFFPGLKEKTKSFLNMFLSDVEKKKKIIKILTNNFPTIFLNMQTNEK